MATSVAGYVPLTKAAVKFPSHVGIGRDSGEIVVSVQHRLATALVVALGTASSAYAADLPFLAQTGPVVDPGSPLSFLDNVYVHLGPAALIIDAGAKIYTPAGRVPGATIKIAPQVTAAVEAGYYFTPNWAVSVTAGVPPKATIDGAGTVGALGRLGDSVYGPVAVTAHYHFTGFGAFRPYIGGGPAYMIAFNSHDGTMTNLQVRSAWGFVGQVGADYMINQHFGVFVDFKKAYLRTSAIGGLGAVPISADVKLDPYILSGGLTYRF